MLINNQTNNPVEWEQTGNGPTPEDAAAVVHQYGQLSATSGTGPISPVGLPDYSVKFTNLDKPSQTADSRKFPDAAATVTLNDNWTVTVS